MANTSTATVANYLDDLLTIGGSVSLYMVRRDCHSLVLYDYARMMSSSLSRPRVSVQTLLCPLVGSRWYKLGPVEWGQWRRLLLPAPYHVVRWRLPAHSPGHLLALSFLNLNGL